LALKTRRVLVVDDDPLVLSLMEDLLESYGYEVTAADSAAVARAWLAAGTYDILLVDAPMVQLDCLRLARDIRATGTPVLMLPAGADFAARVKEAGLPFLTKPFSPAALRLAIGSVAGARS
jgi:DNA-binding response OmpR family regulator